MSEFTLMSAGPHKNLVVTQDETKETKPYTPYGGGKETTSYYKKLTIQDEDTGDKATCMFFLKQEDYDKGGKYKLKELSKGLTDKDTGESEFPDGFPDSNRASAWKNCNLTGARFSAEIVHGKTKTVGEKQYTNLYISKVKGKPATASTE